MTQKFPFQYAQSFRRFTRELQNFKSKFKKPELTFEDICIVNFAKV